jgi:soluble lytic murein transglycosylase-like protein
MNLGELLGGAGVIGKGWREAEDAQRRNRHLQLQTDEMNRLNQLRQEMLKAPMPQQMQLPQFGMDTLPVRDIPVQNTEPSSFRRMTPDEIARLQQDPYAEGKVPVAEPVQQQRTINRAAPDSATSNSQDVVRMREMRVADLQRAIAETSKRTDVPARMVETQRQMLAREQALLDSARQGLASLPPTQLLSTPTPAAPAARPATAKPVTGSTATQYDNKVTPYDDVIKRSAEQYGIDPMMFKRLLGTESSFSPVAVSPRGEKFGLGIAQIASSHGLTREQRLDPNTAIPFAAQLFSKYLQESGGNYEVALQKYKGASSDKGKAAMAGPISTILSGLVSSAQAAEAPAPVVAPPPAAAAGAPSKAQVSEASQFYLANPQAIPLEMQRAMQQRGEIERLAGMYQRSGMGAQFMEARAKLMEVDNGMTYLHGMQGLQEFTVANDPRRLAAVWSQYAGLPIGIQPRSDGKFDILVNGKRTKEGVSASDISNSARLAFDQTYRQQQASAGAEYNKESFKAQLKMQENQGKELAQMIREIAVKRVEGNMQQALEFIKQARYDVKPTGAGDGTVIIVPPGGGAPYLFNPSGRTIEVDGVKITTNAAYPISGLPSYGGVKQ